MINLLFDELHGLQPELVKLRRDFHMYPELSNQEERTPKIVADFLEDLGLKVNRGVGGNGVVGYLKGDKSGKTIALRADFDALPIQDQKDVPYKSQIDGISHACGHDVHTAALLGVAKVLSQHVNDLHGTIVFIHQFAEEVAPGGAGKMIADGCLEGVDAIYGSHVWSENSIGEILFIEGPAMAAADVFEIKIQGKGGHGAKPHEAIDPVVAACQLVTNMQQIVSRNTDPLKSAVLTVGSIHSGKAPNVIPDDARIEGTVRTFDSEIRELINTRIQQMCTALEINSNVKVELNYTYGHHALHNHINETRELKKSTEKLLPNNDIKDLDALMGAEDFSAYLKEVPGTFFFVGGRNEELNAIYQHHHPKFDVDERAMNIIGNVFLIALQNEQVINQ